MPVFEFECPEGHRLDLYLDVKKRNRKQKCPTHQAVVRRVWDGTPPATLNANGSGGYTTPDSDYYQLGRRFNSAKEQDEWMAANGKSMCTNLDEVKRLEKNRKDVTQDKNYIKAKHEIYNIIKNAGGVEMPDGTLHQLDDKNNLKKVDPNGC